jgi:4-amino-4-deoxy-L-arabinose transferase-like glycosyltransferase
VLLRGAGAGSTARNEHGADTRLLTRRSLLLLGLILLLAAGLRWTVFSHAPPFLVPKDSPQFYDAGYALVNDGQFELRAKRAPLYPLFLAGVIGTLGWELEWAVLVQHALGLATVALTYWLGTLAFGRPAGLLAALLVALDGALLLLGQSIMSETLYTPLLLASLVALLLGLRGGRRPVLLLAGLLLGLVALTRPAAQLVLPLVLLAVLLALPGWRARLLATGLVCLGYGLVVTPWLARNQIVNGSAAISSGLGDALFGRVHLYDRQFDFRDHGPPPSDPRQAEIRARIFGLARRLRTGPELRAYLVREFGLSEAQSDAALRDASLQVVRQEPGRLVRGSLAYFVSLGLFYPDPLGPLWRSRLRQSYENAWPAEVRRSLERAPDRPESDYDRLKWLTNLYQDRHWGPLVALFFILGSVACLAAGARSALFLLPAIVVSQILLYVALDGPEIRYRTALQPLIAIVSAGGLLLVVERVAAAWQGWDRRSLRTLLPRQRPIRSR